MNKRQRTNFAKLIEAIKRIPAKHFNMTQVVDNISNSPNSYVQICNSLKKIGSTGKPLKACGAVGCVMGFCPVFFPRSFKYDTAYGDIIHRKTGEYSFRAMSEFFGMSRDDSLYLFDPYQYSVQATKPVVINRMKQFLKNQIALSKK